ncbi:type II restriction endonuclease [Sphingomonas psychrotolerans]|uniref:Type II restriction endonuclease n=1 Tax=Sphingomonas psychrotolerans TaxID=1327635 RepID=A0ABU3MXT6_9SPHN|nr:type II restriction endonuclease [Sphingomonas psychrotolerans]MDT8757135.1 type II restriction endonuclease [Sphingomonas psychrotolerans]
MQRGFLSDVFAGVVVKRLTLVETITEKSNQHEFQGTRPLRQLLGEEDRRGIPTRFLWLSGEQDSLSEDGFMSWSNVRKGKPRAPEFHLYYSANLVTEMMRVDDMLFLALKRDGSLLAIVTPAGSTIQNQLLWLFGLNEQPMFGFTFQRIEGSSDAELDFAARYILDEIGIAPDAPDAKQLDTLIDRFGLAMPPTRILSELARSSLPHIAPLDDPDRALVEWMDREEQLFRRLERRVVAERITAGFVSDDGVDVDGFLSFSLSVQNRRKSRAGHALENHLEAIFVAYDLQHRRGAATENRNKPDFLFPGPMQYRDPGFPVSRLTMLGAKSTAKDRWRQVLSEADRIPEKHLLTLEPGISEHQTDEMRAKALQLVVPSRLHPTYRPAQQGWLIDLATFLSLVRKRQENAPAIP